MKIKKGGRERERARDEGRKTDRGREEGDRVM